MPSEVSHGARNGQRLRFAITMLDGSEVAAALKNVNGNIGLTASPVGGGIETANGGILVGDRSRYGGPGAGRMDRARSFQ